MEAYRLKTSDVEAVQINPEWNAFLFKEKGITSNIGDYWYKDIAGTFRVMPKVNFERLFKKIE